MLPSILQSDEVVSFALVDVDQYAGAIASLRAIVPRLQKNGLILVDDYTQDGVRTAIDEAQTIYPALQGGLITHNFYILWKEIDRNFLSIGASNI